MKFCAWLCTIVHFKFLFVLFEAQGIHSLGIVFTVQLCNQYFNTKSVQQTWFWSITNISTRNKCNFLWSCSPTRVRASPFLMRFLDHTQRRTTVGRAPLDKSSARRRDLFLKTQNTHNRQTFMSPVGFEPTISAGERLQTYALDRAATGNGKLTDSKNIFRLSPQNTDIWQQLALITTRRRNTHNFTHKGIPWQTVLNITRSGSVCTYICKRLF